MELRIGTYKSKLFGDISISTLGDSVSGLTFNSRGNVTLHQPKSDIVEKCLLAVDEGIIDPQLPLYMDGGSSFQLRVWSALIGIPSGSVASYKDIAQAVGSPGAVRAVGTACGLNPIAVLIPCHRVIRSDGKMGGYRWGLEIKNKLLEREKLAIT